MKRIGSFLYLFRARHWVKNLFVFLPAFFALKGNQIFSVQLLLLFLAFCLTASVIYIINDLADIDDDRLHPVKKNRPLAAGQISRREALLALAILITVAIALTLNLGESKIYLLAYFLLNLSYTFRLKQIAIIDVSCIGLGFLFRILAGGSEVSVPISNWMIIVVFLLTVSIALAKRRSDLLLLTDSRELSAKPQKLAIRFYEVATSLGLGLTLMAYLMYTISPEVIGRLGNDQIYITSFFVFLGILRYLQIFFIRGAGNDPTETLWSDRFLQVVLILWISTFAFLIYG